MKNQEKVHVMYATDDNYAILAGISIISLLENNPTLHICIHIQDDCIGNENKKKLMDTVSSFQNAELEFIDINSQIQFLKDKGVVGYGATNMNLTTCGRLFISQIVSEEIGRMIYIDCDTLINGSIEGLWKADLNGKVLGMARDCLQNRYKKVIGLPGDENYYNAGVMIIDLKKWRGKNCLDRILNHLCNVKNNYPLVDQDFINVVLHDDICLLGMQYNYLSQYFLYDYKKIFSVYELQKESFWSEDQWIEPAKKDDIVIYHFCGKTFLRPWFSNSKHPVKKLYDTYYHKSAWNDCPQQESRFPLPYCLQYVLYRYFPKCIAALAGKIMQRMFMKMEYHL